MNLKYTLISPPLHLAFSLLPLRAYLFRVFIFFPLFCGLILIMVMAGQCLFGLWENVKQSRVFGFMRLWVWDLMKNMNKLQSGLSEQFSLDAFIFEENCFYSAILAFTVFLDRWWENVGKEDGERRKEMWV